MLETIKILFALFLGHARRLYTNSHVWKIKHSVRNQAQVCTLSDLIDQLQVEKVSFYLLKR